MKPQEIEAKFHVNSLLKIKKRLREMKAQLIQKRMHEANIRYDTPELSLRQRGHVLRLRLDDKARLTYKGPGKAGSGIISRTEIEFVVEDFDLAKIFLESLGYEKLFFYEKYRSIYQLDDAHVMLDELPYGTFVEIEGAGKKHIKTIAASLGLEWEAAVEASYHSLFERIRKKLKLKFTDLSFKNFKKVRITPEELGVKPADKQNK